MCHRKDSAQYYADGDTSVGNQRGRIVRDGCGHRLIGVSLDRKIIMSDTSIGAGVDLCIYYNDTQGAVSPSHHIAMA